MGTVFVSSTGKDLADYREAACRAIEGLDGFHADRMENWGARSSTAEAHDERRIAAADVIVLIVGHCYGSSPPGQELSYTELEYETALRLGKPVLAFIANDDFPVKPAWIESDTRRERVARFRDRVLNGPEKPIARIFEPDPNKLANYVTQALFHERPAHALPPPKPARRLFNVPRRPDLIGRKSLLAELHRLLQAKRRTAVVPALSGQGGVGKTQLAALYADEHAADYPAGIFWLVAAEATPLVPQLARFARDVPEIDLPRRGITEDDDAAEAFLGWLGNQEEALLVLDNVDAPRLLTAPLPGLKASRLDTLRCAMLVTTRTRKLPGCVDLAVDTLVPEDARVLLLREAERSDAEEETAVGRVLDRLGGLPLALRIAGTLVRELGWSYGRLADHLQSHGLTALDWDEACPADYEKTVRVLMQEQWASLPADALREILLTLGQLPEAQEVRIAFLEALGVPGLDKAPFGDPLEAAVEALFRRNVVERPRPAHVRLHPLVRGFAADTADDPFRSRLVERAARRLADPAFLARQSGEALVDLAYDCRPLTQAGPAQGSLVESFQRCVDAQAHHLREGFAPLAQLALVALRREVRALAEASRLALAAAEGIWLRPAWSSGRDQLAQLATLKGHGGPVMGCALAPDGKRALSASYDGSLIWWDLERAAPLATLKGHSGAVNGCALAPDGKRALSASSDGSLIWWDLERAAPLATLKGHGGPVMGCALAPDGKRALSASDDGSLIWWDLERAAPLATLKGHSGAVNGCALAPDGKRALSASDDGSLIWWDLERAAPLATLKGHTDWVRGCALAPDGKRALSASWDGSLIWWDLERAAPLARLALDAPALCCSLTADGRFAFVGDSRGDVYLIELVPGREE